MIKAITLLRWMLLLTFPAGWYFSYPLVESQDLYYFLLTVICEIATSVILIFLGDKIKQAVNFWIILLIFWMAYFLKFYILCYMNMNQGLYSDYLELNYATEASLLNQPGIIINYFEVVTVAWVCFAMMSATMVSLKIANLKKKTYACTIVLRRRTITKILMSTVLFSIIMIGIQVTLGLGMVSTAERQTVELPFRLAGIIMTINNLVLPLLFLLLVLLADNIGSRTQFKLTTGAYLLYGLLAGVISTSRSVFVSVVISLLVLWMITEKMCRKRIIFLISLIPITLLLNGLLSLNRILRSTYPELGGFDIFILIVTQYINPAVTTFNSSETNIQIFAVLSTLMRASGTDSMLRIIDNAPEFSLVRFLEIIFGERSSAEIYATEVLGLPKLLGVAFSPSLIGFFFLLFGNNLLCIGISFALYLLLWQLMFRLIISFQLLIEPIILVLMFVMLARFTSEGTLEALPLSIAFLICIGGAIEWWLRRLVGNTKNAST